MNSIKQNYIFLLFIAAFLIRFVSIDQSLWLDEATTAVTVAKYSIAEILTKFSPTDFHPPLYYLVMDLWTQIFGISEFSLRVPSVIFSIMTGLILMKIFRGSDPIFLFNPLIIYYSQEARMYSMATFLVATSFYFFIKMTDEKNKSTHNIDLYLFLLFAILSFYTFYATVFFVATAFLYLVFIKRVGPSLILTVIFSFAIALISPLLQTQFTNSRQALLQVVNWSTVLGTINLKNLLLIPIKFTSGRISFEPKILYYGVSVLWLLFYTFSTVVGLLLSKKTLRTLFKMDFKKIIKSKFFIFSFFLITPLFLGIIFSISSPLLQYFRFQYLIIFLSLLVAYSCSIIPNQKFKKIIYSTIVSGSLAFSLIYLFVPQFHREDWKSLTKAAAQENLPIYMITSSSDPLKYYAPNLNTKSLKEINSSSNLPSPIIVIPYTADIHGVNYAEVLNNKDKIKITVRNFRGLQYEVWR